MTHLVTTDNNLGKSLLDPSCSVESACNTYKDLSTIANISLKELCQNNPSLIVFPRVLGGIDDGIAELNICELSGSSESPKNAKITTGNLMGFIGYGQTQLSIQSRFTKADGEDCFLHYMLEKVGLLNLFDLQHSSSKDSFFDFLLYLFPTMLKKAANQGVFKTYCSFEHNDTNIKGVIDIPRHIRSNIPFTGNIAYKTRERTYDNPVTELIRHAIEIIKTKPNGKVVLFNDSETKTIVNEFVQVTTSYNFLEREKIIAKNIQPLNHPYYTYYRPLQQLCLAILLHHKLAYRNNANQVYGVLFDGAWLWEEYLALVLKAEGFSHPRNKVGKGGIKMFEKDEKSFNNNHRRIYPDFYRPNTAENKGCIIDAKYKRLQNGVGREDLYQVVTYMHTMRIDNGGFIYPLEQKESSPEIINYNHYELAHSGYGGVINVYGIKIPDNETNFEEFCIKMNEIEKELCNEIASQKNL